ncbi:MAG: GHMP kinase, partial [Flavobacteriaceae bacterium]|nr:GHMP kinase [Flavobacteriaceae bacterium]
GQTLHVQPDENSTHKISWKACKNDGSLWAECLLDVANQRVEQSTDADFAQTLLHIFVQAQKLNPDFLKDKCGYFCETHLQFPENWGLGTSSTLINNIAQWAEINPYQLLKQTFGGSGYDIACAQADTPILFQFQEEIPVVRKTKLSSQIIDNLIFIYLNQKQNSREGICLYRKKPKSKNLIDEITQITQKIVSENCTFQEFASLMELHELLISDFIGLETVKKRLFPDYQGFVKSLGAWGGDFVMAEKIEDSEKYFKNKGHEVVKNYSNFLF